MEAYTIDERRNVSSARDDQFVPPGLLREISETSESLKQHRKLLHQYPALTTYSDVSAFCHETLRVEESPKELRDKSVRHRRDDLGNAKNECLVCRWVVEDLRQKPGERFASLMRYDVAGSAPGLIGSHPEGDRHTSPELVDDVLRDIGKMSLLSEPVAVKQSYKIEERFELLLRLGQPHPRRLVSGPLLS